MIKSSWGSPGIVEFKVRAPVRTFVLLHISGFRGVGWGRGLITASLLQRMAYKLHVDVEVPLITSPAFL